MDPSGLAVLTGKEPWSISVQRATDTRRPEEKWALLWEPHTQSPLMRLPIAQHSHLTEHHSLRTKRNTNAFSHPQEAWVSEQALGVIWERMMKSYFIAYLSVKQAIWFCLALPRELLHYSELSYIRCVLNTYKYHTAMLNKYLTWSSSCWNN